MERPKLQQSDWGWIGLVGGITVYELMCKPEQTLSEAYDRYMSNRLGRAACIAVTTYIGAHLLNMIPDRLDPLNGALAWKIKESLDTDQE